MVAVPAPFSSWIAATAASTKFGAANFVRGSFGRACVLKLAADLPTDPMKDFRQMKQRGEKITALTAYDYPTARLLDESGIDIILVGDSLGMVVLGYQDTTGVTLEEMLHHTRAVARGVKQALLVADMPIHTYDTPEQAVETARKFVDAGAQAVKLEGGASHVAQIEAITKAGIPFMAHIGMLPQSVREEGGYRDQRPDSIRSRSADGRRPRGGKGRRIFCRAGDCGRRYCKADHKGDRHPNHRHRLGRALRRANPGHARLDWTLSVVHAEICVARSARGRRNPPRRERLYRANACGG